jgi:hypothetical protein
VAAFSARSLSSPTSTSKEAGNLYQIRVTPLRFSL